MKKTIALFVFSCIALGVISHSYGGDMMIGGEGADMYGLTASALEEGGVTIQGFNKNEGDAINISSLMSGYDTKSDALGDYLKVEIKDGTSILYIDVDGKKERSGWSQLVEFSGVTDLPPVDALIASGNLII